MDKSDDWKGEHFIHSSVSHKDRAKETKRIVNKIFHENRRKKGIPAAGSKGHAAFITAVYRGK